MAAVPTDPSRGVYPMTGRILNVVLFNAGWFACVLGAAAGRSWIGPLVVTGAIGVHLWLCWNRRANLALIFAGAVIGFGCDCLLVLLAAHEPKRWILPQPLTTIWLVAMWANFAPLLNVSLRWLRGRLLLAAVFGAISGPIAYYSGQQLGALRLRGSMPQTLAILAAVWAGAVPLLVWLSEALERHFAAPIPSEGQSPEPDAG